MISLFKHSILFCRILLFYPLCPIFSEDFFFSCPSRWPCRAKPTASAFPWMPSPFSACVTLGHRLLHPISEWAAMGQAKVLPIPSHHWPNPLPREGEVTFAPEHLIYVTCNSSWSQKLWLISSRKNGLYPFKQKVEFGFWELNKKIILCNYIAIWYEVLIQSLVINQRFLYRIIFKVFEFICLIKFVWSINKKKSQNNKHRNTILQYINKLKNIQLFLCFKFKKWHTKM